MSAADQTEGGYNAAVDFLGTNIAAGRADKLAYVDPARALTFGDLREYATRVGPMLARLGIGA